MTDKTIIVKFAVVQTAPVLFNRDAMVGKTVSYITDNAQQGAQLVLFPETFIPTYHAA